MKQKIQPYLTLPHRDYELKCIYSSGKLRRISLYALFPPEQYLLTLEYSSNNGKDFENNMESCQSGDDITFSD